MWIRLSLSQFLAEFFWGGWVEMTCENLKYPVVLWSIVHVGFWFAKKTIDAYDMRASISKAWVMQHCISCSFPCLASCWSAHPICTCRTLRKAIYHPLWQDEVRFLPYVWQLTRGLLMQVSSAQGLTHLLRRWGLEHQWSTKCHSRGKQQLAILQWRQHQQQCQPWPCAWAPATGCEVKVCPWTPAVRASGGVHRAEGCTNHGGFDQGAGHPCLLAL